MRDRSIDEFESIFEQASIPVLDIDPVALTRIGVVLSGGPLDESILRLATYLKARFQSEIELYRPASMEPERAKELAGRHNLATEGRPYGSTAELVGQVSIGRSKLVLFPDPVHEQSPAVEVDLDALVQGTTPPILIVRTPIQDPSVVFKRILHGLTGNFRQTQNFAFSFTMVASGGRLFLLHVIEKSEIRDVRETLRVSPEVADESGEALIKNLTHHGERYLKAVVEAARDEPFDVGYRLGLGEIVAEVRRELASGEFGLLVVGSHEEGHSHVSADDYQLMHQVRDIPVLAL